MQERQTLTAPNYTAVMSEELVRIATEDERVVAITAGMPTGTGVAVGGLGLGVLVGPAAGGGGLVG